MNKKKILISYTFLAHYRIPVFEALGRMYHLTVTHSGRRMSTSESSFQELILSHWKIGRLQFQRRLLQEIVLGQYDAVIFFLDVGWVSTLIAFMRCSKETRRITWGAWKTRLYPANLLRKAFLMRADANIFYGPEAASDFIKMGVPKQKTFVARNTVEVKMHMSPTDRTRDMILFVGSLDARKQNDVTITAFANICDRLNSNVQLTIVGDGVMKGELERLAAELKISERVLFVPGTIDSYVLSQYYARAIASVSFGQAGLSVLQSLGYGVPFITKRNAISGGEIANLRHGYNALLCDDNILSLQAAILCLCQNPGYARTLGANAAEYYKKNCSVNNMIQGFVDAIEGARFVNEPELIGEEYD